MNKYEDKQLEELNDFWENKIKPNYDLNFETGDERRVLSDIKDFISSLLRTRELEIEEIGSNIIKCLANHNIDEDICAEVDDILSEIKNNKEEK